jgi:hypothetical protein
MTKAEATGEDTGGIIEGGELRLAKLRHRYAVRYILCLVDGLVLRALAPYMAWEEAT